MRSCGSHSSARRRRRWLAATVAAAWVTLATLAQAHIHAHAAATYSHCSTCHSVRGAAAVVVPTVVTIAPPAPEFATKLAERLSAAQRGVERQLHLRGPPRA
jgi:hypothetical protein